MTKRRRTPVGTEPPPDRPQPASLWLDGSWLVGMQDGAWPEHSVVEGEDAIETRTEHPFARGSNPPSSIKLPRAITSEPTGEAAGTIDTDAKFDLHDVDARVEAYEKSIEAALDAKPADEESSVIVKVDDDWLARLDLPPE